MEEDLRTEEVLSAVTPSTTPPFERYSPSCPIEDIAIEDIERLLGEETTYPRDIIYGYNL